MPGWLRPRRPGRCGCWLRYRGGRAVLVLDDLDVGTEAATELRGAAGPEEEDCAALSRGVVDQPFEVHALDAGLGGFEGAAGRVHLAEYLLQAAAGLTRGLQGGDGGGSGEAADCGTSLHSGFNSLRAPKLRHFE